MTDKPLDQRLQLIISKGQIAAIDEWRRAQPDLPNRSAAIRRLIDAGLSTAGKRGPSGSGGEGKTDAPSKPSRARTNTMRSTAPNSPVSKEAQLRALRESRT